MFVCAVRIRTCDSGMWMSRECGGKSHIMSVLQDSSGSCVRVCVCVCVCVCVRVCVCAHVLAASSRWLLVCVLVHLEVMEKGGEDVKEGGGAGFRVQQSPIQTPIHLILLKHNTVNGGAI